MKLPQPLDGLEWLFFFFMEHPKKQMDDFGVPLA